jgi:hypothetical protein
LGPFHLPLHAFSAFFCGYFFPSQIENLNPILRWFLRRSHILSLLEDAHSKALTQRTKVWHSACI